MTTKLPVVGPEPEVDLSDEELEAEIRRLKAERNAVILAHYYQESELQDLADHVGDSLQLSQAAAKTQADVIAFCGVHFMAETAKILNPDKVVVVPDLTSGCSLADGCPAPAFARWLERYPGHCTSSNAVKIVKSLAGERIVFAPARHLGAFVAKQAERPDLVLWQGTCVVHETFSERRLLELMAQHPDAEVIAHPECHEGILRHAAYIASTSGLITYAARSAKQTFIVATEAGILHKMQAAAPGKTLIAAPPDDESCACNVCPHMRKNTLAKLYLCLRDLAPQVDVPEATRVKALRPIQRMLEMSV